MDKQKSNDDSTSAINLPKRNKHMKWYEWLFAVVFIAMFYSFINVYLVRTYVNMMPAEDIRRAEMDVQNFHAGMRHVYNFLHELY